MTPSAPQTISQLLRADNRFTDRDYMRVLGVREAAFKQLEANPYLFTLDQFIQLAELLGKPVALLAQLALEESERNMPAEEQAARALRYVTARKIGGQGPKA